MKVHAYILAADPAWIEDSILSYYDEVDRLIVSFDEDSIGWTGLPVEVESCLSRLKAIDKDGKFVFSPGKYARSAYKPMENETYQRQRALDEASVGADWVMQLDTDEVVADPEMFRSCLEKAERGGFEGMDYPARWLYRATGDGRYLESCRRSWRIAAGYPGPMAVKSGGKLRYARQCDVPLFRVDFLPRNTDPYHPADAPVHQAIGADQGIVHYAWVRDEAEMIRKSKTSGHAFDIAWQERLQHWRWCGRHPFLATLLTPLPWRPPWKRLRLVKHEELFPRRTRAVATCK